MVNCQYQDGHGFSFTGLISLIAGTCVERRAKRFAIELYGILYGVIEFCHGAFVENMLGNGCLSRLLRSRRIIATAMWSHHPYEADGKSQ